MSSNTFISVWVRQALGSMMERAAHRGEPIIMGEALASIRRRFPGLAISNEELAAGVMGEAVAAGAKVVSDGGSRESARSMYPMETKLSSAASAALQVFFSNYSAGDRAFAVSDAIREVRQVVPESELSNNDLLAAIAAAGTGAHLNVAFDVPVERPKAADLSEWENEGGSPAPASSSSTGMA